MNILTQINSSGAKVQQHFFQSNLLLLRRVTTIINQDVYTFYTFPESAPKGPIRLVANKDRNVVIFICFACFLNIYSVYVTFSSKIGSPHFKASTTTDTNFQDIHLLTNKPRKMPVINVEVVLPFPDTMAFLMLLKILPKWIYRRKGRGVCFCGIICICA